MKAVSHTADFDSLNDLRTIKNLRILRLTRIEVYYDDYITGIALTYLINEKDYYRLKYFGQDRPKMVNVLDL